ncbi:MAG: nickel/cobalt transporter [Actinomycetota bacterium]
MRVGEALATARRRLGLGAGLAVLTVTLFVLGVAGPAHAHPLGNFSVNRFAAVEVGLDEIGVRYVVDMAEVPTFQEMDVIDADGDEAASAEELDSYARVLGARLRDGLRLEIDGDVARLESTGATATVRSGQAGLDVLRVELRYISPLAHEEASIRFADSNYSDRIGWREVVVYGVGGQGIAESSVPSDSASDELRSYPEDLLSSPLRVAGASIEADPSGPALVEPEGASAEGKLSSLGRVGDSLSALLGREASPLLIATALSLALGAGALHALGPGHGKTIMAVYLVGAGGRVRHALSVGVAVSLMHTASVVALGLVTLWASSLFPPESVFPWLSLVSGGIVLSLGAWLLQRRLRSRGSSSTHIQHHHSHAHEEHSHHVLGDDDRHGHPHDHHHLQPEGSLLSWKGLGAIAVSGGLLPSPTALVVLLGAVALHRVALGVAMVGAFSVGLAAALTGVGILVLKARDAVTRRFGIGMGTSLGIASAMAILLLGAVLTTKAVLSF